jgi:methylthioribose-1-phosphate isomerase
MEGFKIIEWLGDRIKIIDQTKLPHKEVFLELRDCHEVADAIKKLCIRGAPDIGVAAAYGFALAAQGIKASSKADFLTKLRPISDTLASSRPTAVNLFWALERMNKVAQSGKNVSQIKAALIAEAQRIVS